MSSQSVTDSPVNIEEMLSKGSLRGLFAKFPIFWVSYYPSERIIRRVAQRIYGVEEGWADSEVYREMERRGVFSPPSPSRITTRAEGDFLFFKTDSGEEYGLLDLRRLTPHKVEAIPEINVSIVSDRALFPHIHRVKNWGYQMKGGKVTIYTRDDDNSGWSLHCCE